MRVVAGTARGVRLDGPDDSRIRPTSDRVREAVFNALYSLGGVEGWNVVDLFAGTGAMGIEALSRGAASCRFVEQDRRALALIETNLDRCGFADRARIERADAAAWRGEADLVIADPPYAFDGWDALAAGVDSEWLLAESDRAVDPGDGWQLVRSRAYGGTVISLARRSHRQETRG